MKWSALGDLVISSAIFADIRQAFPHAVIDLQTVPAYASLFANDPSFQTVHAVDVRKQMGLRNWLKLMLRNRYDLVFDLQSNDRSRLYLTLWLLTGRAPRWRVGNHDRFPYNIAGTAQGAIRHAFDVQKAALAAAGVPNVTPRPRLYPGEEHRLRAADLMAANDLIAGRFAIFFPGTQARGILKRWGSVRYAGLARRLKAAGVDKIVLLGGPDDEQECRDIVAACPEDWLLNLCGQTRILDLVPVCQAAKLIVANDTGPAHVASATPTPMVVICGPTDPRRVKPVGDNVVALQAGIDCINCYKKECDHHSCMRLITAEMVVERLRAMGAI